MKTFVNELLRTAIFIVIALSLFMVLAGIDRIYAKVISGVSLPVLLFILGCFSTFFVTRVTFFLRPSSHDKVYGLR